MDDEFGLQSVRERLDLSDQQDLGSREPRFKRWILFDGDRAYVALLLLFGVFATLVLAGVVWPIEYRRLVTETGTIQTVFNQLLSGVILLVSIVVAVASVGISQELTSLGEQNERIETAVEFRRGFEQHEELSISPARPGQVIVASLYTIDRRMHDLKAIGEQYPDSQFQEEIADLAADIEANINELALTVDSVKPGTTDELLVGLDYNCSWQLHQVSRLQVLYGHELDEEEIVVLDELDGALRDLMTSREYFKTLYYKREFSDLSTMLLIVSLPVILFITYVLLALDTGLFPEVTMLGLTPLAVFINLAYTIALAPYVILTAYVLRAASVTKRTPAVGPFVINSDRDLPFGGDVLRDQADD